ncbi:MAG: hypothetical protein WA975_04845 [Mesorhizobium sp.]
MQQNQGFRGAGISALLCLSLVGGGAMVPFEAVAQDQARDWSACECVASYGDAAQVRFAEGRVSATQANGLLPVRSNATVRVPGKVVAGPQSSAVVAVGNRCDVRVGSNETLEIRGDGARLCLARLDGASGVVASSVSPKVVGILLGIGGVAAIAAAIHDPDRGVSR